MNDDIRTPQWLKDHFYMHFDPCKYKDNEKLGLIKSWESYAYVNPPYSNPKPWVEKALLESKKGCNVVMLLRVDISTRWYKMLVERKNVHIAYFNERIFKGSNFCSMLVFIEGYE